jgi:hypothetical protein
MSIGTHALAGTVTGTGTGTGEGTATVAITGTGTGAGTATSTAAHVKLFLRMFCRSLNITCCEESKLHTPFRHCFESPGISSSGFYTIIQNENN